MKERIQIEDALKHLHECEYRGQPAGPESLAGVMGCDVAESADLLIKLQASRLVALTHGAYHLTNAGRRYARHVVRAHRLYETYLARETGLDETEWHHQAEKMEHALSDEEMRSIAAHLEYPRYDPHGDPIPTAAGELPPRRGIPLLECASGWTGRIVHIEDEPDAFYSHLVSAGLAPGMRIRVLETEPETLRMNVEGRVIQLRRATAGNLVVMPLEADDSFDRSVARLSDLKVGETASIVGLSPACRGPERNRLLDLGLVPDTPVQIVLSSPAGSPIAYRIRGASIALRREQADRVIIRKTARESA